jgi:DNA-binding transcriptional LysR family regulator
MASLENFRLVVFRNVAERLSFRRAAEALYLTQPAVSLQIKALEEDLGLSLFERSGRAIVLTPAGELLLRYTRQVSGLLAEAERELAALSGELAGTLSIGASTTIAQYLLPRLLAEFRRTAPRIEFSVLSGNTETIVAALEQHRIDLGLIEGPAHSQAVTAEPFLDDEIVLIASTAHEWSDRPFVTLQEIPSIPLLIREPGSGTRQVLELALERCGLKRSSLRVAMELDSTEAIKSAVAAGLGLGFVSRWALEQDLRLDSAFRIIEVQKLKVHRQFMVVSPRAAGPQGLAQDLRRFLFAQAGATRVARPLPRAGR